MKDRKIKIKRDTIYYQDLKEAKRIKIWVKHQNILYRIEKKTNCMKMCSIVFLNSCLILYCNLIFYFVYLCVHVLCLCLYLCLWRPEVMFWCHYSPAIPLFSFILINLLFYIPTTVSFSSPFPFLPLPYPLPPPPVIHSTSFLKGAGLL